MDTVECIHCKTVNDQDYTFCQSCYRPSARRQPSSEKSAALPYNWTCKLGHENRSEEKPKAGDRCRGRRTGWKKYFQRAANCHESYKLPAETEGSSGNTAEPERPWGPAAHPPPAYAEEHDNVEEPTNTEAEPESKPESKPEPKPDANSLPTYTSFARYESFYENAAV